MFRSYNLGQVDEKLVGKEVTLAGWVDTIRSHGKLIFFDLRDRYGKVQCVVHSKTGGFKDAEKLSLETCMQVKGQIKQRPKGTENKELKSGNVELSVSELSVLNSCKQLPFDIKDQTVAEELRLKYRFLDLRSKKMQENILLRSRAMNSVLNYFNENGFVYLETPILAKSTPEGARDYIVPSRNHKGCFYALPQSPQLFKQLSMVAGFDRYIQIARCFRDEDLRSDRQPEFTQIDVEMSFIEQDDIISIIEGLLKRLFKEVLGKEIKTPFQRITYQEAMKKYGTDRPDLRKNKNDVGELAFCWVLDFPLLEYSKEDKRYKSVHHPFTMPDLKDFEKKPETAKSLAYDIVLNGVEIGGGSIRIHNPEIQQKVFDVLKISKKEAKEKFGFLLEALSYGSPPHGGIALGFDRLIQIMAKETSIREVIAFPKNKEARDVMLEAPSEVAERQLKEVNVSVIKKAQIKRAKTEGKKVKKNNQKKTKKK